MGLFDSVYFPCPTDGCGGTIEVQSKAGDCFMGQYHPDEVPAEIAADIGGEACYCPSCHNHFVVAKAVPDTFAMRLVGEPGPCPHCGK